MPKSAGGNFVLLRRDGVRINNAVPMAKAQAAAIAAEIERAGGPAGLADREIVAIVAYMQRLGQDIKGASGTRASVTGASLKGAPVAAAPTGGK